MSFAKFTQPAFLLSTLRFLRFVGSFTTVLIVLAAAQSKPIAQAHQPSALPGAQQPSAGVAGPPAGTKQPPPVRFKDPGIYNSGGLYSDSVAIGDLNGDGKPDLVVTSACPCGGAGDGVIGVLLGNGDGTFQPAITYDPGDEEPLSVAIGDVNGDGKPDLVVATLCGPLPVLSHIQKV